MPMKLPRMVSPAEKERIARLTAVREEARRAGRNLDHLSDADLERLLSGLSDAAETVERAKEVTRVKNEELPAATQKALDKLRRIQENKP
jgi:hypothetical protein